MGRVGKVHCSFSVGLMVSPEVASMTLMQDPQPRARERACDEDMRWWPLWRGTCTPLVQATQKSQIHTVPLQLRQGVAQGNGNCCNQGSKGSG